MPKHQASVLCAVTQEQGCEAALAVAGELGLKASSAAGHVAAKENWQAGFTWPMKLDVWIPAELPAQITIKGSVGGYGPVQSKHVRRQVDAFAAKLTSRLAALEKSDPLEERGAIPATGEADADAAATSSPPPVVEVAEPAPAAPGFLFANENIRAVCMKMKKRVRDSLFQNLGDGEVVKVVIIGAGGQAIAGTDTRLFILKSGYLAGATFGSEVTSWSYRQITGIQVHKGIATGGVIVQAPGQSGLDTSYWKSGKGDLWKAPNAIPIAGNWNAVRAVVAELQQLIDAAHAPGPAAAAPSAHASLSIADEIRKLSELRDSGSLTEDEFAAAKQRLLHGG